jgi:hypothetical protein
MVEVDHFLGEPVIVEVIDAAGGYINSLCRGVNASPDTTVDPSHTPFDDHDFVSAVGPLGHEVEVWKGLEDNDQQPTHCLCPWRVYCQRVDAIVGGGVPGLV